MKKRVLLVYTGGTIGMDADRLAVPDLSPAELSRRLKQRVPELAALAHCDVEIALNRDSAHIGPDEWVGLADRIRARWKRYEGVVLLHGTDTLAYTASALSFLLRPCLKPVILTGAQRPLAALRTDARRNLISAVEIAATGPRPLVNRVLVFFDDRLLQGNRVRKRSAAEFGAFESPRSAPIALVGTEIRYAERKTKAEAPPASREKLLPRFSRKVAMLHLTPGFPAGAIERALLGEVEAIVAIVFPSGTAPTHDPELLRLLRRARERGVPVVAATEGASQGPSSARHYEAGRPLLEEGCLWAGQMTPECAFVKASLILGQPRKRGGQPRGMERFARLWSRDLAGEGVR